MLTFLKLAKYVQQHIQCLQAIDTKAIGLSILTFSIGVCVCIAISINSLYFTKPILDYSIPRKSYEAGQYQQELEVQVKGEKTKEKILVEVLPRTYTNQEIEEFFDEASQDISKLILGENKSLDRIEYDMNLITDIHNTPITVTWFSSNIEVLDWEGKIGSKISKKGENITLKAELQYEDQNREVELVVKVFPKKSTQVETFKGSIENAMDTMNMESDGEVVWHLPKEINGKKIIWSYANAISGGIIIILFLIASVCIILGNYQEKEQNEKKRQRQLILDYPYIINKLTLLIGAGLSSRSAFAKMALDYKKIRNVRFRFAYEEILAIYYEMESGVSEMEAYEHIGIRCKHVKYKTLANLLSQNLRRGSQEMLVLLEREAIEAFEERKLQAKILGEEAGTKLLIPMVLMLLVVLIILIVPAYLSF